VAVKLLPQDKNMKILGINNRVAFAIGSALFFSLVEIFLAATPAFIWVYPWWGAFPVFVTVYIPFFAAAVWCHETELKKSFTFIGILAAINLAGLIVFGALGWI